MTYRNAVAGLLAAAMLPALTSLSAISGRADDYSQWRGPQRSGVSQEKGLLSQWPKEGPKLVWQVKDVGFGFGSPAVVGKHIYLISSNGVEDEYVQALDAKNGRKIWSTKIGGVGQPKQMPSYPGARSTPTVVGDTLYVFGSDGDIAALSTATGAIRWKKNVRIEFGGKPGIWAYSESPLVDGDVVVCTPGGANATLLALNRRTGDVVWKSAVPGGDDACYASVVPMTVAGKKQYVQFLRNGLVGVDAVTGKFLWRFDKTAETRMGGNIPTPVAFENHVYSGSGMTGAGLARVLESNSGFETEQVYMSKKLPNAIGGAVKVGDYLYGTGGTTLYCVDFKTGVVKWEERSIAPASIVSADGKLFLHGEKGDIALVEASPAAYHELGRFTPPEQPERKYTQAWSYPALANGKLYVRDLNCLWCYDVSGK